MSSSCSDMHAMITQTNSSLPLNAFDKDTVQNMVTYLYTGKLSPNNILAGAKYTYQWKWPSIHASLTLCIAQSSRRTNVKGCHVTDQCFVSCIEKPRRLTSSGLLLFLPQFRVKSREFRWSSTSLASLHVIKLKNSEKNCTKIIFPSLVTLTIDLDHYPATYPYQILHHYDYSFSWEGAHRHTHIWTRGTDSIPTREVNMCQSVTCIFKDH